MIQEVFCIVEAGQNQVHPFRRVRDAVSGSEDFVVALSSGTNRLALGFFLSISSLIDVRLHVTYRRPIPSIDVSTSHSVFVYDRNIIVHYFRLKYCQLEKLAPVIWMHRR